MAIVDVNEFGINFPTQEVVLPSGRTVTIREQNGEDEDVLSKAKDAPTNKGLSKFLSRIIVDPQTSANDIEHWFVRDKYFLLLKSRIFSLGNEVSFKESWSKDDGETEEISYTEDLTKFDWDFRESTPPVLGDEDYNPLLCVPYHDNEPWYEFETSSKKKVRFRYLTGVGEKKSLEIDKGDISVNSILLIRDFSIFTNGDWFQIERFDMFSSREMKEIRNEVRKVDPEFDLQVTISNPQNQGTKQISLFAVPDFFYPTD